MSENRAQNFLRSALVRTPTDRLERVENLLVPGMPDVNGCINGREFWIENKQPKEPKRIDTPLFGSNHRFSQEQLNWCLKQRNAGGNVYAFIWTEQRGILISGFVIDNANTMTTLELIDRSLWHGRKPVGQVMKDQLRFIIATMDHTRDLIR